MFSVDFELKKWLLETVLQTPTRKLRDVLRTKFFEMEPKQLTEFISGASNQGWSDDDCPAQMCLIIANEVAIERMSPAKPAKPPSKFDDGDDIPF